MKKLILSSFALVAFVFVSNSASAQLYTAMKVKIEPVTTFEMIGAGDIIDETFTTAQLLAGKDMDETVTLNYVSNKAAFISIKATNFQGVDVNNTMPSSIMSFKTKVGDGSVSSPTSFLVAGTTYEVDLAKGNENVIVSYNLKPSIQANPDNYTSTITYTITAR